MLSNDRTVSRLDDDDDGDDFDETSFCFVCFWGDSPRWAIVSTFTRFLDHTQRRTTVSRTPLDE